MAMRALALALGMLAITAAGASAQPAALPQFSATRLYLTEADFNRAVQPYLQAIAANPRDARAHSILGIAYMHAYRYWLGGLAPYAATYASKAIPPLLEAIKLEPGRIEAYLALHYAYKFTGDLPKAGEIIEEMLKKARPGWVPPYPNW